MGEPASRIALAHEPDFQVGGLAVRPSRREVGEGAGRATLEPRVMQVLVALARRRGEVVSRDELIAACWEGRIVGDDAINACVSKVRRLGERSAAFGVETVPRVGYRLAASSAAPPAPADEVVLAVLPFENLSGDPDLGYFSDGVSEEILDTLAHRSGLKVIGRASSFQFRGSEKDVTKVSRELGATHVLDGSVRRSGQRIRVSAQLVECGGQTMSWSDRFERELADIFDLQDQIAVAVAQAMQVALAPAVRSGAVDPVAYDLFLRGSARPDMMTPETLRAQIAQLEETTRRAPDFAGAWAGLGYVQAGLASFGPPAETWRLAGAARDSAQHALTLDPRCALACVALARAAPRYGAALERERWLRQAVEWAPGDAHTLRYYARHLATIGRCREALIQIREAHRLDPLHPDTHAMLGRTLAENGELAEARRVLEAGMRRWPDFELFPLWLLVVLTASQELDAARTLGPRLKDSRFGRGLIALPDMHAGDGAAIETFVAGVRRTFADTGQITISAMCTMADVGHADEALTLALASSHEPSPEGHKPYGNTAFNTAQLFARYQSGFRRDPRFVEVCAGFGLVDYWLETGAWPDCVEEVAPYYDFKAECRRVAEASPEAT